MSVWKIGFKLDQAGDMVMLMSWFLRALFQILIRDLDNWGIERIRKWMMVWFVEFGLGWAEGFLILGMILSKLVEGEAV